MLASWALAAALALHGAGVDAFAPSGVQLPASLQARSSMPLAARPARFWKPAAKPAGATQLHMAGTTVPKIIQGGMGVQVMPLNAFQTRQASFEEFWAGRADAAALSLGFVSLVARGVSCREDV